MEVKTETKVCTKCNKEKKVTEFHKQKKKRPNGEEYYYILSQCKECIREHQLKRHYENRDENLARLKVYSKEYYNKPENKERKKERWENSRKRGVYKTWQQNNTDKIKEYNHNRQMNKQHEISKKEWVACKNFFNNSCAYCSLHEDDHYITYAGELKKTDLHKEHVIHNGANDLSNCVPCCKDCNSSKHTHLFEDWYNDDNPNYSEDRKNKINRWLSKDNQEFIKTKK